MPKLELTAQEIQAELQSQIDQISEIIEDGIILKAPLPYRHEDDASGCNWNISVVANSLAYVQQIVGIVDAMRNVYRLKA